MASPRSPGHPKLLQFSTSILAAHEPLLNKSTKWLIILTTARAYRDRGPIVVSGSQNTLAKSGCKPGSNNNQRPEQITVRPRTRNSPKHWQKRNSHLTLQALLAKCEAAPLPLLSPSMRNLLSPLRLPCPTAAPTQLL